MPLSHYGKSAHKKVMKLHDNWYPNGPKCLLLESNCQNLRTQMDTWTCDDSGYGYGDWKNILEYDSYDGKKTKKTKKPKTIYPAIKQQGPSFKP